jgi:alkylation response protein AidB-like acyl-CoA dehydrogenase
VQRTLFEPEHDEFRRSVRAFVERELTPEAPRFRRECRIDRAAWHRAGEHGFLGFMVPERYGGGGVTDFRFNVVFVEELARLGYAYSSSFSINTDISSPYLLELTTDEQKERWLPRFCSGDLICAIALTEPGTGSDLAAISTSATLDGDDWVLNGAKTFITNGVGSDLVLVVARTGGRNGKGLTMFGVEAGTPGLSKDHKLDKLGQPEADTSEIFFDDVVVPAENVIGEVDAAFGYLMTNLAQERLSVAVASVSHATRAFEEALAYAKERQAFGQAIGTFQHNKFALAHAATDLDVAQAWIDRCIEVHLEGGLTTVEAAKAKYWATEVEDRTLDLCVQLFGGYGYMREQWVGRAWVDARVTRIFAGTNEIMREVIGRSLGL